MRYAHIIELGRGGGGGKNEGIFNPLPGPSQAHEGPSEGEAGGTRTRSHHGKVIESADGVVLQGSKAPVLMNNERFRP